MVNRDKPESRSVNNTVSNHVSMEIRPYNYIKTIAFGGKTIGQIGFCFIPQNMEMKCSKTA